ncbi:peptidoglycan recognition protein-like [Trichoplusia ni]|uniref:Peptidoglycan-recognition protein n=1 Tax=Trichoplusia ni TaxID=7111 RepID=A0A7E5W946_TRINI|nr:peptidoglycan recognition protein-like [Trichoplusia ni]
MKFILFLVLIVKITVEAKDGNCGVIPITTWGNSELLREETLPNPIHIAIIQHTATADCMSDEDCEKLVRSIRSYHINHRGFTDIGQSFLIGGNGRVYEGAGWHHVGAHTKDYNKRAVGISFIGDFRSKIPSPSALKALRSLLACGVVNKYLTEGYHLVAHSQLSQTDSPGETLRKHVEMWPHWLDHAREMLV